MKEREKDLLFEVYGKDSFLKIKQRLAIGKILFSFVDMNNPKEKFIDCYMEAEEFGATLMTFIKNGTLINALKAEKAKGETYPKAVWQSPVGGNATGNNGSPISRYFEISPANKSEVLFTANAFPAEKSSTGAFIKKKGSKALMTFRIPCTFNDLRVLQYKWSFLEADYMTKKYTLENMKSDYQPRVDETETETYSQVSEAVTEEAPDPFMDAILSVSTKPEKKAASDKPKAETVKSKAEVKEQPKTAEEQPKAEPVTEQPNAEAEKAKMETKVIKMVAITELTEISGKPIKVCKVKIGETEKRLVCMTDKFADKNKFSQFESQLKAQISKSRTLEFSGAVVEKGEDLYLCKFA